MNNTTSKPLSFGIIGGGWFGQAFAKAMLAQGIDDLILTTTTAEKLTTLTAIGAKAELLSFPFASASQQLPQVFNQQVLVIAIPPGFKKGRTDYAENITEIVTLAEQGKVEKIILLNSTAIYNGLVGEVDENSELQHSANKVALLAQAEDEVFKFTGAACSLRLAGLVGEDRHPGRFVANAIKNNRAVPEPNAYVNLIHQQDVIGLVQSLANQKVTGIFNGVSSTHLEKHQYYKMAAQSLQLEAPSFAASTKSAQESKKVTDAFTRATLNYQYQYDDLVAWLDAK